MNETPDKEALTFKLNEDNKLLAVFEPVLGRDTLDEDAIMGMIIMQGLSNLFLDEQAISNLVQLYNNAKAGFVLEIGERRDGGFTIYVTKDKMSAFLSLTPPYGGSPVTLEQVHQYLAEKGIVSGIITDDEIETVLDQEQVTDYLIAEGSQPVPGFDAQFHSLVPEIQDRTPKINEQGIADFRDLGQLIIVKPGDPLMRRTPATEGRKGENVFGQVLTPKPSKNTPFSSKLKGTMFAPDDSNLLLAAITGQPILESKSVVVSPTITVPQVDISTGNISFDGTINILGDVMEGMKVYALEDIFIGGTVEAAVIEAGGNVSVKGGIIGTSESSNNSVPMVGKISCKGAVSARFAKHVSIDAGTSIILEEYSMNNKLTALNQVLVGKPGRRKGLISGGTTSAMMLIQASTIGSSAGIKTYIQAGLNPRTQGRLNEIDHEMKANEKSQEDIKRIITFVQANPEKNKDGLLEKAQRTLDKLKEEVALIQAERETLLEEMSFAEYAKIVAEQSIYQGVEVRIGNQVWNCKLERGKTVFRLVDRRISVGSN